MQQTPTQTTASHIPVNYDDASHVYSLHGKRYISASQLLGLFKHVFDVEERSRYMADRYGNTPDYWKQKWKAENRKSLERGDSIHDREEQGLYRQRFVNHNPSPLPVLQYPVHTPHILLPDGVYPEMMLWNHDRRLAGRSDKVILYTSSWGYIDPIVTRYADVEDYKTNKKMRTEGWGAAGATRKFPAPLEHLEDCELVDYSLQLSIYMYMLEQMGFVPGKIRLIHFPHEIEGVGTPKPCTIELQYMRAEVLTMLNHYQEKLRVA